VVGLAKPRPTLLDNPTYGWVGIVVLTLRVRTAVDRRGLRYLAGRAGPHAEREDYGPGPRV